MTSETFYSTCGHCRWCRSGRPSICAERRSVGTHVDGAFAPRVRMPARNLHRVPDALSDLAAAICEPLACVCNSLSDPASVDAGDEVLVIGPGAIGLLAAQVARANGGRVHVRGTPARRGPARARAQSRLRDLDGGSSRSRAMPRTSSSSAPAPPRASPTGLETVTRGGTIVQMGLRGAPVTVPFDEICFKELRVRSGFAANPIAWLRAMRLLRAGAIQLEPLITRGRRAGRLRARLRALARRRRRQVRARAVARYWCGPRMNAFVRTRSITSNVSFGVALPSASGITASTGQTA